MKSILKIIGVLVVLFSLNSCTVYYYSVLDSDSGNLVKNVDRDFVDEDDSVLVAYCFYGENAPINITVYNKSEDPLYVDWNSSALIIEDVATSYREEMPAVRVVDKGRAVGVSVGSGNISTGVSISSGAEASYIVVPQGSQIIPPHSKIEHASLRLGNFPFENIPKNQFAKQPFVGVNGQELSLHLKRFNEVVSPVRFRSYLTLYKKDKQSNRVIPIVKEHSFYVSEVIRGGTTSPRNFVAGRFEQGDFFYVTREKGTGFAVAGIVALSIATAVMLDDVSTDSYYHYHYHY